VVNVAVLDAYIPRVHFDAVTLAVADRAVSQYDVICKDANEIVLAPIAIHQDVFVHARFGDAELLDSFRVRVAPILPVSPAYSLARAGLLNVLTSTAAVSQR
jgi:hypothetical protein